MIKRLRLQNWRSHSDSVFEFSSGVNALLGIMGSGKSSAMDALCFGLFGNFPALNQRRIKLDEVIRARPEQKLKALVEVTFTTQTNEEYTVIREIELGKGTSKAEIRHNNELLESSNSQSVTLQVSKLLKIEYDVFSRAVYAEQNQMDRFLNIPKGKRMERIDQLLKIDRFEDARKTAGRVITKFSDELSSKELLSKDILEAEELSNIVNLEREKRELEEKIKSFSVNTYSLETKKQEFEERVSRLEKKQEQLDELKLSRATLNERLENNQKRLIELSAGFENLTAEDILEKIQSIKQKLAEQKQVKSKCDEFEKKKAGIESTIVILCSEKEKSRSILNRFFPSDISVSEILEKKEALLPKSEKEKETEELILNLAQVHASHKNVQEKIEAQEFRSVEFQKKMESCTIRRKNAQEIIEKLSMSEHCPLCESDINETKKNELIQKQENILQQINQEQSSLNSFVIQAKNNRSDLKKIIDQWVVAEEELKTIHSLKHSNVEKAVETASRILELDKKIEESRVRLSEIQKQFSSISEIYSEDLVDNLKKGLSRLEDTNRIFELKQEIQKQKEMVATIDKTMHDLDFDKETLVKIREQLSEIIKEYTRQKTNETSLQDLLFEKVKRLEGLNRKRELAEKYREDIKKITVAKDSTEIFQNALKRTQESLRAEFIESVNQIMGEVWTHVYPYGDISAVKLIVESGDYILSAKTRSGWINVEGRVSGGERSLACLTLRVAFSLALAPNLSWLVLDEPTHNLDVPSIELLSETLRERLPKMIDQIFLITHEERLESAVSGNMYKLERNKELDEATRILN